MALSAVERSLLYQTFARGFSFPREEFWASLAEGGFFEVLSLVGGEDEPRQAQADLPPSLDDLQQDYTNLFDVGRGAGPLYSLYEGSYVSWARTGLFEELLRFYDFFGLELASSARELPDHLTVELEFMHYLTFLEARAIESGTEDASPYQRAQKDFLERHLWRWAPIVARKLEQERGASFFRTLAIVLGRFITSEAFGCGLISDEV